MPPAQGLIVGGEPLTISGAVPLGSAHGVAGSYAPSSSKVVNVLLTFSDIDSSLLICLQHIRQAIQNPPHSFHVIDPLPIFQVCLAKALGDIADNFEQQVSLFIIVGVFSFDTTRFFAALSCACKVMFYAAL